MKVAAAPAKSKTTLPGRIGRLRWAFWIAVVLVLWEVLARYLIRDRMILPPASDCLVRAWELLGTERFSGSLLATMLRVAVAYVGGVAAGILIAMALHPVKRFQAATLESLEVIVTVPQSLFLPIFILVLGVSEEQIIVFGLLHVVFLVWLQCARSLAAIEFTVDRFARSIGLDRLTAYLMLMFPMVLPTLISTLKICFIFTTLAVLTSEMYASSTGLGHQFVLWAEQYKTVDLFAGIIVVAVISILISAGFNLAERRVGWE